MSTPPPTIANVVVMPAAASAEWPSALSRAWAPIQEALVVAWENWAQASDDALFRRSERGDEARDFFEGMRLLRRNRPQIERDFWSRLRQHTDQWLHAPPPMPRGPSGPAHLSLVENEDLEESLAVAAMGDRAVREAGPQWHALAQRLNRALSIPRPMDELPFGPSAIAMAFRSSLDQLAGMSVPVRLVLLKLFERHAWASLGEAVTEANRSLIQSGVLPHLEDTSPVLPRRVESPPASPAATRPNPDLGAFLDQVPHRHSLGTPSQDDLLHLLTQLRPWLQSMQASSADPAAMSQPGSSSMFESALGAPADPSQWRHAILERLPVSSRHKDHEQAIDLVALVFEFLLKDSALPLPVQAMLGRLQLPYLRVAVLDPHGFAQANHPARQLLDTLSQAGQAWSEAEEPTGQRFAALRVTVQALLEAPDEDVEVFDRENEAWKVRLSQESKRQQQFEQRAVQVQEGQDRRTAAQHDVAQALTERLADVSLPPVLRGLMNQHWGAALTLFWLRHGPQSTEYRRGVFVMDQLKFIAHATRSPQGVQLAQRMSTGLEKTLRQGWGLLGLANEDVERMTHAVLAYVADRLGTEPPVLPVTPSPGSSLPQEWLPVLTKAPAPLAPPSDLPPAPASECEKVAALTSGTWLEFEHRGAVHRGKLSWISPFSGRLLIVSAKGLKVADLEPQDVARQLASGQAQILPDQSLIQRALATRDSRPLVSDHAQARPRPCSP